MNVVIAPKKIHQYQLVSEGFDFSSVFVVVKKIDSQTSTILSLDLCPMPNLKFTKPCDGNFLPPCGNHPKITFISSHHLF